MENEQELYEKVISHLDYSGRIEKSTVERNGRRLHLVGEEHGSREAVDYAHFEIVPKILVNPNKWMILREGLYSHVNSSEEGLLPVIADHVYFTRLPTVLGIPADDVIKCVDDPDVKKGILRESDLTEKDVDAWLLTTFVHLNKSLVGFERRNAERRLIQMLDRDETYVEEVFQHAVSEDGPMITRRVHEKLMPAWNRYTSKKLDEILAQHPSRTDVLVSAGIAHLPAFCQNYTAIG